MGRVLLDLLVVILGGFWNEILQLVHLQLLIQIAGVAKAVSLILIPPSLVGAEPDPGRLLVTTIIRDVIAIFAESVELFASGTRPCIPLMVVHFEIEVAEPAVDFCRKIRSDQTVEKNGAGGTTNQDDPRFHHDLL